VLKNIGRKDTLMLTCSMLRSRCARDMYGPPAAAACAAAGVPDARRCAGSAGALVGDRASCTWRYPESEQMQHQQARRQRLLQVSMYVMSSDEQTRPAIGRRSGGGSCNGVHQDCAQA
jgi:hypothetical protein